MHSISVTPLDSVRTVVRWRRDPSCAAAALATLLRHHYGLDFGEADIVPALGGDDSPSLLDLRAFLRSIGLDADGYRLTLELMAQLETPAIVLLERGKEAHFAVIKGVRDGRVLVGDPDLSLRTYARAQFRRRWNGVALMINPLRLHGRFNRADEWAAAFPAPSRARRQAQPESAH